MNLSPEERSKYMALKVKMWRTQNPDKALATQIRAMLKRAVEMFNIPQETVDEVIKYLPPPVRRNQYSHKKKNKFTEGDVKND